MITGRAGGRGRLKRTPSGGLGYPSNMQLLSHDEWFLRCSSLLCSSSNRTR